MAPFGLNEEPLRAFAIDHFSPRSLRSFT